MKRRLAVSGYLSDHEDSTPLNTKDHNIWGYVVLTGCKDETGRYFAHICVTRDTFQRQSVAKRNRVLDVLKVLQADETWHCSRARLSSIAFARKALSRRKPCRSTRSK